MTIRQGQAASYEYHADILDGVTGPAVILPILGGNRTKFSCSIFLSAGSGKVQYTLSPFADVSDGSANWIDWDMGDVTEPTSDALISPVTALRGVSISGTITIDILV